MTTTCDICGKPIVSDDGFVLVFVFENAQKIFAHFHGECVLKHIPLHDNVKDIITNRITRMIETLDRIHNLQ